MQDFSEAVQMLEVHTNCVWNIRAVVRSEPVTEVAHINLELLGTIHTVSTQIVSIEINTRNN